MEKENGHLDKQSIQGIMHKVSNKVMDNYIILVAIFIKEISSRTKDKDTGRCSGLMDHFIKAIGKVEYKMEKGICI